MWSVNTYPIYSLRGMTHVDNGELFIDVQRGSRYLPLPRIRDVTACTEALETYTTFMCIHPLLKLSAERIASLT